MDIKQAFPGTYFKAADFSDKEEMFVIADGSMETLADGEKKFVLRFEECQQALICNKTNAFALAEAFGDETEQWVGKTIILYSARVQGPGGLTNGVRIKIP